MRGTILSKLVKQYLPPSADSDIIGSCAIAFLWKNEVILLILEKN